ncbi:MAG TPA: nuclear transport factor 2 family protein [Steroidobacteraceae bacterium]
MLNSTASHADEVRALLESWAKATRENRKDDILKNHRQDLVIFDVLPPMKYDSAESYRRSWGDWQPETQGDTRFDLEDLSVTATADMAAAHCFIRCGGFTPDGRRFEDWVRATFCLHKSFGSWKVFHQHVSKPFERGGK